MYPRLRYGFYGAAHEELAARASQRREDDFFQLTRQHVIAQATIFNLFDASTPTAIELRETAPPSRFGQVTSRVQPFRVQLGLRYQY